MLFRSIYHPRFIRLVYDHYVSISRKDNHGVIIPRSINLHAFPNPFNNLVSFDLDNRNGRLESVIIYDLAGRRIRSWNSSEMAGMSILTWDGQNDLGHTVTTGTYFVKASVENGGSYGLTKITLLK